jgi:hypothetical protein
MKPEELDPEQCLAELRELQKKIPSIDDDAPTPSRLDAELILGEIASIRKRIPFLADAEPRPPEDARFRSPDGIPIDTEEDFEWAAVIDAMESLHNDLTAGMARKRAAMAETVLDLYYAMEEASHDPENAHLIEHVENMRAAYERDYGRPIPPKGRK